MVHRILSICLYLSLLQHVHAQLVTTVAGVPEIAGYQDGTPYNATFNNPHGLAADTIGNIYVADRYNHTIRKIGVDGMVSTIAGTPGISGDQDGAGIGALFNEPWGICASKDGTLYIADTRNNKIRKITPDGDVSTVAGTGNFGSSDGNPLSSTFGNPTGIEIDEVGNIYVADHLTHTVRLISNTGIVSTLAGAPYSIGKQDGLGSAARFHRPYGLTLDNDGNILVADEWNHLIRKVTPEGEVTTIAGVGTIGLENGVALEAKFNYPWDITVDENGLIYIADGYNYVIRLLNPVDGTIQNYVGTPLETGANDGVGDNATFNGATALALNKATNTIYIGDAYNHLVRKIITDETGVALAFLEGNSAICEGELIEIVAQPQIFANYEFYVNETIVQNTASPTFISTELPDGQNEIRVIATKEDGEVVEAIKIVNVTGVPTPVITPVGSTSFFEGDSLTLVASQGDAYLWSNGATTPSITVGEGGDYTVQLTYGNGCQATSEVLPIVMFIEAAVPTVALISETNTACFGDSITLSSSYIEGNQWFKDGWPVEGFTEQNVAVKASGIYQVQVTSLDGTVLLSEAIEVFISNKPIQSAEANFYSVGKGIEILFSSNVNSAETYNWNFGDGQTSDLENPTHSYSEVGEYPVTLEVITFDGCTDMVELEQLILVVEETGIYLPNAFTPNNDGNNDVFALRGTGISDVNMQIFNQWGNIVFQTSNQYGWEGICSDNTPAPQATYTYLVQYETVGGTQETLSGHITLIR